MAILWKPDDQPLDVGVPSGDFPSFFWGAWEGPGRPTHVSAEEQLIKELHGDLATVETLATAQEAGEKLMELSQKIGGLGGLCGLGAWGCHGERRVALWLWAPSVAYQAYQSCQTYGLITWIYMDLYGRMLGENCCPFPRFHELLHPLTVNLSQSPPIGFIPDEASTRSAEFQATCRMWKSIHLVFLKIIVVL